MHTTTRQPLTADPEHTIVDVWHQRHDAEPAYLVGCWAVTQDPDVPRGVDLLVEALDAEGMIGIDVVVDLLRHLDPGRREVLARAMLHIEQVAFHQGYAAVQLAHAEQVAS